MKHSLVLLLTVFFGALLSVQAASLQPSTLEPRASRHHGGLNQKCRGKHQPKCNTGLYCHHGRCRKSSHPSHPSSAQSATASKASAALASATPVSNSQQYNSNNVLQGPGQVRTTGDVRVVTTQGGKQVVEVFADAQHPAVVQEVLQNKLTRRQAAQSKVFSFNYNVVSFTTTATGQCNIVPSIDGNQLSPLIVVTTGTTSGKATYAYTGSVTSYALALVCDDTSSARVQYDSVAVTTATTATSTTPSTSAVSTTPATSSPAPTATPTADTCSGLPNCSYEEPGTETGGAYEGPGSSCSVKNDAALAHTGTHAQVCTLQNAQGNDDTYAFLIAGEKSQYTYVTGQDYTWVFWVKFADGANAYALTCLVVSQDDDAPNAYNPEGKTGTCRLTTTATQNGYYQVAIPFTATTPNLFLDVRMSQLGGTYSFDDFSILKGMVTFDYATTTSGTPPATPTSTGSGRGKAPTSSPTPAPPTSAACSGLPNCSLEDVSLNILAEDFDSHDSCAIQNDATYARTGTHGEVCTIKRSANTADESAEDTLSGGYGSQNQHTYVPGNDYTWVFWVKVANGASLDNLQCFVATRDQNDDPYPYQDGTAACPLTTAAPQNGFYQVAIPFTATSEDTYFRINVNRQTDGTYAFDDFSMLNGYYLYDYATTTTTIQNGGTVAQLPRALVSG